MYTFQDYPDYTHRALHKQIREKLQGKGAELNGTLLSMLFDTDEFFYNEDFFNEDSVRAVLEYGVNPNFVWEGKSLLNMCVHNTENPNYLKMTRTLLEGGADPNLDPGCTYDIEDDVMMLYKEYSLEKSATKKRKREVLKHFATLRF